MPIFQTIADSAIGGNFVSHNITALTPDAVAGDWLVGWFEANKINGNNVALPSDGSNVSTWSNLAPIAVAGGMPGLVSGTNKGVFKADTFGDSSNRPSLYIDETLWTGATIPPHYYLNQTRAQQITILGKTDQTNKPFTFVGCYRVGAIGAPAYRPLMRFDDSASPQGSSSSLCLLTTNTVLGNTIGIKNPSARYAEIFGWPTTAFFLVVCLRRTTAGTYYISTLSTKIRHSSELVATITPVTTHSFSIGGQIDNATVDFNGHIFGCSYHLTDVGWSGGESLMAHFKRTYANNLVY